MNEEKKENGEEPAQKASHLSDRDLTWPQRAFIYGLALVFGACVAHWGTEYFLCLLKIGMPTEYSVIHPSLPVGIFLFGLVVSVGTWIIRTADAKKQFADTLRTQTNITFTEASRLLLEGRSASARGAGLAEIAHLLHQKPKEYEERIKRMTASGLRLGEEDPPQSDGQKTGSKEDKIKVVLGGADLSKLQMPNADLRGARLQEACLSQVDLSQALLQEVSLQGADLQEINLERANLAEANLREANLKRASLVGANFEGADLTKAELSGANLQGANLQGANLQGANLQGARYSEATKFPDGFDPDGAGMR